MKPGLRILRYGYLFDVVRIEVTRWDLLASCTTLEAAECALRLLSMEEV